MSEITYIENGQTKIDEYNTKEELEDILFHLVTDVDSYTILEVKNE